MSRPTAICFGLELLDVGAADRVGALLVELRRVDAADVVRLEDLRVDHCRNLTAAIGVEAQTTSEGAPMKRLVFAFALLALLAVPAPAMAKGLTNVSVCGPEPVRRPR